MTVVGHATHAVIEVDWSEPVRETRGACASRERERSLITRVIVKPMSFPVYIQLSPKQGAVLDLITHVHIFKA